MIGVRDEMVGKSFGRWTVISADLPSPKVLARCQCGEERRVVANNLRDGRSRSCRPCASTLSNRTHGKSGTPAHTSWRCMRQHRNNDPRWDRFEAFFDDLGARPQGHVLYRPEASLPWGPDNALWLPSPVALSLHGSRRPAWKPKPLEALGHVQREIVELLGRSGELRTAVICGMLGSRSIYKSLKALRRRGVVEESDGTWRLARRARRRLM